MAEQQPNSIKSAILRAVEGCKVTDVVVGTVISDSPLRIQVANDPALVLGTDLVRIPQHLTEHTVPMDIPIQYGGGNIPVTVHAELKVGEAVYMLRYNGGSAYLAIGRR